MPNWTGTRRKRSTPSPADAGPPQLLPAAQRIGATDGPVVAGPVSNLPATSGVAGNGATPESAITNLTLYGNTYNIGTITTAQYVTTGSTVYDPGWYYGTLANATTIYTNCWQQDNPSLQQRLAQQRLIQMNPNVYIQTYLNQTIDPRIAEVERQVHQLLDDHRALASGRAKRLLVSHLTPAQRATFEAKEYFDVPSKMPQHFYRIFKGRAANVIRYKAPMLRGSIPAAPDIALCCHPADYVPDEDTMLTQKFMLEHQEAEFLKTANKHQITSPMVRPYLQALERAAA